MQAELSQIECMLHYKILNLLAAWFIPFNQRLRYRISLCESLLVIFTDFKMYIPLERNTNLQS